jgi:hypothetical protein
MKSGNLNFLEPSRPLQVCNGTALTSTLPSISDSIEICPIVFNIKATVKINSTGRFRMISFPLYESFKRNSQKISLK